MKNKKLALLIAVIFSVCAAQTANAQDVYSENVATGEDVILQWNRVLTETLATPGQQPPTVLSQRSFAMMHLAMFDAVNSIDGSYKPYLTLVDEKSYSPLMLRTRGIFPLASKEAAAAKAARDVLVGLYPGRQAVFDAELANSLQGIQQIPAILGIGIGEVAAARMLAHRAGDGWSAAPPPYVLSTLPGNWQPTPPANAAAVFTHFSAVVPFAMTNSSQFLPPPPPALTSAEYTADFIEAKELGAANSQTRTADQTQTAQLWASGPVAETRYNNLVRMMAVRHNNSTVENARLFALYYLASHDTLQTTFTSKFVYGLWRPVTAIRRADEDGNPNTAPDTNWTSLIGAPPYPAYAGNAAASSAAVATTLSLFYGRDDIEFQINFGGAPNVIRNYQSFSALNTEVARSRVYGGIHFNFDNLAGQTAGHSVANYVFQNFLTPR